MAPMILIGENPDLLVNLDNLQEVKRKKSCLLAILWNSTFKWVYLSFSPLLFTSLFFTAICKASSDRHFAFLPLPDHAGESTLLSRSGGEKGLRGSGAGTLGVPLGGTRRVGGSQ